MGTFDGDVTTVGQCTDNSDFIDNPWAIHFFCQGGVWKLEADGRCGSPVHIGTILNNNCDAGAGFQVQFLNVQYSKGGGSTCATGCLVDITITHP